MKGTWKNPAVGSPRADIVLTAPQAGVPLLFIEVDNCTEEAALIAAKFDKYKRFFLRQEKDTDNIEKPLWCTRWSAPVHDAAFEWGASAGPARLPRGRQAPPRCRWPGSLT
ncbi:replication-relaxation family protein [Streptomyces aureus]